MKTLKWMGGLIGLSVLANAGSNLVKPPHVWLADDLIGMKVVSMDGDSLGKIDDVVVHPGGGTSYAVLSFGGWLGMGDKLFAMPWTVLRPIEVERAERGDDRSLVLQIDKERLKTAPGFDKENWPAMANPDWAKDVDVFYVGDGNPNLRKPVEAGMRTSVISWRATELEGTEVKTPEGKDLGDIEQIAIDQNGRVSYAVLSVGGFLGVGDKLVAVPWDSMQFSLAGDKGDEKRITLAATKEQLMKAIEFKTGKENAAEMCDPIWIGRVYEGFSCKPYWDSKAPLDGEAESKS